MKQFLVFLLLCAAAGNAAAAVSPDIEFFLEPVSEATSYVSGSTVTICALVSTDSDLDGWEFGVSWNPEELSLLSQEEGAALQTLAEQNDLFVNIDASIAGGAEGPASGPGLTQVVVVSTSKEGVLPPGSGYELQRMTFRIEAEPVDPDGEVPVEIIFTDTLGDPVVKNIVVIGDAEVEPEFKGGSITVKSAEECQITGFTCEGDVDQSGTNVVHLSWSYLNCEEPRPFDVLLLYRDAELLVAPGDLTVDDAVFLDSGLEPGVYTYTLAWVYWPLTGDPITLDYVECEAEVVELRIDEVVEGTGRAFLSGKMRDGLGNLVEGELVITGSGFMTAADTEVLIGDQPVEVIEVIDGEELHAKVPCSSSAGVFDITVKNLRGEYVLSEAFLYGWLRGDVDMSGELDLQDCLDILILIFRPWEADPVYCYDAVDVNDTGEIDISDVAYLCYALFSADPLTWKIPEPYDAPLVEDPTGDLLDCTLEGYDCTQ